MTTPIAALDVIHHDAEPVNPTVPGLYAATDWQPSNGPARFLNGAEVKGPNYGGEVGVWDQPWCGVPPIDLPEADRKYSERPDVLEHFEPLTIWAYDECDLTRPSRAEVEARAAQILRLGEQAAVERTFAARLLLDAGTPEVLPSLKAAVGYLEGEVAKTNTVGYFHVGAQWASQEFGLFTKAGTRWVSPLGNIWVIGGGYVEGLDDTIVATSQPIGWRDAPTTRTAIDERHNRFVAVAERSVTIGYEAVIAAATITAP